MAGLSRREAVLVMGAFFALVLQSALAATYTVGGSSGWIIPISNAQLYTSWVSGKTFKRGDHLVFNFQTGQHDVLEVTKTNYDSCGKTSPIGSYVTGPVNITLNSTGSHYYICSVGTHCQSGQKIAITVAASSPASSPSSSPPSSSPPSSSGSPTSSEAPSSIPAVSTPPPGTPSAIGPSGNNNSSASRLTASFGILLSGAAALFFL